MPRSDSRSGRPGATPAPAGNAGRWLLLAFAGLGGTSATVPSVIPSMAAGLGVPATALLPAVSALFVGLLAGVLVSPLVTRRLSLGALLRAGAGVQALGLLAIAAAPSPAWFVAGALVAGLGFGLVEVAGTALTRAAGAQAAPRLLIRLNLAVAIVGTLTPVLVLAASSAGLVRAVPVLVALAHLVTLAVVRDRARAERTGNARTTAAPISRAALARVVVLGVAIFCYVGVETILSGWSAATVEAELGTSASTAALGTSAFWLLVSLGRFAGTLADRAISAGTVSLICAGAMAVSLAAAAALSGGWPAGSLALLGVAVFFAGPSYALLLGTAIGLLPDSRAVRASSALVAIGSAGGAAIPAIAAAVVLLLGARASTSTAAVAAVVLLAAVAVARGLGRPTR